MICSSEASISSGWRGWRATPMANSWRASGDGARAEARGEGGGRQGGRVAAAEQQHHLGDVGEPLAARRVGAQVAAERHLERVLVREIMVAERRERDIDHGGIDGGPEDAGRGTPLEQQADGLD